MSENTVRRILKSISIGLIVLSALMLFMGGVGIKDKDVREEIGQSVDELIDKVDMDDDKIDQAEAGLAMFGVDIDLHSLIGQVKKVCGIVRDGRLSAAEVAFTGTTAIKLIDLFKQNDKLLSFLSDRDLSEMLDRLDGLSVRMYALVALFWASLACSLLVIIFHLFNFKAPGVSVVIFSIFWLVIFIIVKEQVSETIVKELEGPEGILAVSAAPFIGVAASVCAMVIWLIKDVVAEKAGSGSYTPEGYESAVYGDGIGGQRVKNVQGAVASEDMGQEAGSPYGGPENLYASSDTYAGPENLYAESDTYTGGIYEDTDSYEGSGAEAEGIELADTVFTVGGEKVSTADLKYCPKCGAEVDHDYDFCSSCGFRIFSR